jgi:hypothetical protein
MNARAQRLSAVVSVVFLALGASTLVRPLTEVERWLPADRLLVVAATDDELVGQILGDEQLRERVLVLPSSSTSSEHAAAVCERVAAYLGERHPSFAIAPQSLVCRLALAFADDRVAQHGVRWFEGFSPVPPQSEPAAWARYGLELAEGRLRVIGRGRRPGPGPGYNREIGY